MVVDTVRLYLKLDDLGRPELLERFDPVGFSDFEKALFASGADQVCVSSGGFYKKVFDNASNLPDDIPQGVGWSSYRFLTYELVAKRE